MKTNCNSNTLPIFFTIKSCFASNSFSSLLYVFSYSCSIICVYYLSIKYALTFSIIIMNIKNATRKNLILLNENKL